MKNTMGKVLKDGWRVYKTPTTFGIPWSALKDRLPQINFRL
jgi:hypothetical protein